MNNTEQIQNEINEAITKHLPSQVGTVLKQRLEKLEELESQVSILHRQKAQDVDKLEAKDEQIKLLNSKIDLNLDLEVKEADIAKREFNLKLALLETELKAEQKISNAYHGFLSTMMKNPVYTQSYNKTLHTITDYPGSPPQRVTGESIGMTEELNKY